MKNSAILILTILIGFGCSLTDRQFVEEMEGDEFSLFVPGQDFPTVAGDNGRAFRSSSEIMSRTPASKKERERYLRDVSIEEELVQLEQAQSERENAHYLKNRRYLESTSEKIYFLKLATIRDRDFYLHSKGRYNPEGGSDDFRTGDVDPDVYRAIKNRDLVVGMTKDSVIKSWGRPARIDVAGNPQNENERWAFFKLGKVHYVFFEQGKVQGWSLE